MLAVEIEPGSNQFEPCMPTEIVDLVFSGQVSQATRARSDLNFQINENGEEISPPKPLAALFEPSHFDGLSRRLLKEVHRIYGEARTVLADFLVRKDSETSEQDRDGSSDADPRSATNPAMAQSDSATNPSQVNGRAMGLEQLEHRVVDLTNWDWGGCPELGLRIHWLAAWLAELRNRPHVAIDRYDRFLRSAGRADILSPDRGTEKTRLERIENGGQRDRLELLAINNRAVLLLRQIHRRSDEEINPAIYDLVELAMFDHLPGACLSLLNLMNTSWERSGRGARNDTLTEIDSAISLWFNSLLHHNQRFLKRTRRGRDAAVAKTWIDAMNKRRDPFPIESSVPKKENPDLWISEEDDSDGVASEAQPQAVMGNSQDSTAQVPFASDNARRRFCNDLAKIAHKVQGGENANVLEELELWPTQLFRLLKAPPSPDNVRSLIERHFVYSEAVSLLYPRDILGATTGQSNTVLSAGPRDDETLKELRALVENGSLDDLQEAENRIAMMKARSNATT